MSPRLHLTGPACTGHGDYVEERRELFRDLTLDEAIARARAKSGGGAS